MTKHGERILNDHETIRENIITNMGTSNWKIKEIENDLRAQIEKALCHIPHCSHFTPHMEFHEISQEVVHLVLQLAREYDLDANIRLLPLKYADLFSRSKIKLIGYKNLKPWH